MSKIKLKTPNSLILDIYGVISSHHFKNELKIFAKNNLLNYINNNWNKHRFKKLVKRLIQDQNDLKNRFDDVPDLNNNLDDLDENKIELFKKQIYDLVSFRIDKKYYGTTLLFFFEDIWQAGYLDGTLKSHVYEEIDSTFHEWRMKKYIKLYTLASGKSTGQKLFFQHTIKGDLSNLIANYLDSSTINKEDKKCFQAICLALRSKPEDLIYFTNDITHMKKALEVNFQVVLVKRSDFPIDYDEEDVKNVPIVNSLSDIEFVDSQNLNSECC